MVKALINGILKIMMSIANMVLLPVNALINGLFPDLTDFINRAINFINNDVSSVISFFFNLLPPIFRSLLLIWLLFYVSYKTVHISYLAIIKVWTVIQKIKFW